MNIAFVADNKQIEYLAPLIRSLETYHPNVKINYYVLTAEGVDFDKLVARLPNVKNRVHHIVDPEPLVEHYFNFDRVTEATFLKISLFKYLPKEVDKFIYLDVDTICNNPIDDIWCLLEQNSCVAVPSPWSSFISKDGKTWTPKQGRLTICPGLFGVDRTFYPDFYEKCESYLFSHDIANFDGEVNAICNIINTNFYRLPQYYQFCIFFLTENRILSDNKFVRYIEQCPLKKIKIIHYDGADKPWNSRPLYCNEWDKWLTSDEVDEWLVKRNLI